MYVGACEVQDIVTVVQSGSVYIKIEPVVMCNGYHHACEDK